MVCIFQLLLIRPRFLRVASLLPPQCRSKVTAGNVRSSFEIVYGIHPVWQALLAGKRRLDQIYVDNRYRCPGNVCYGNPSLAGLCNLLAGQFAHLVRYTDRDELSSLCHGRAHQGFALQCGHYPVPVLSASDTCGDLIGCRLCVLVDQVVDILNFASLLRTCLFYGASPVLIPGTHTCPPLPVVSKISCGALEASDLRALPAGSAEFVRQWRQAGWLALGSSGCGDVSVDSLDSCLRHDDSPVLLLLGSESVGLAADLLGLCSHVLRIPAAGAACMMHLNVGVAGGILLHQITRWMQPARLETLHRVGTR